MAMSMAAPLLVGQPPTKFTASKILILTIPHGTAHQRVANALKQTLSAIRPDLRIEVVNVLDHCPRWFRFYYNSYEIPLKYWPSLWGWIENLQHTHASTGPSWLFHRGARRLLRFMRAFDPDIVIATEVGICEIVAMIKRETKKCFYLVGAPPGADIDRAWVQPEVDLYAVAPGEAATILQTERVPHPKVLACGVPIDPLFASLPEKATASRHLQVDPEIPLVVVQFGGTGYGNARRIFAELQKLRRPAQVVFISGRNPSIAAELARLCAGNSRCRVLQWVDNIHEWMAAADLLIGKPGGTVMMEALSAGVPLLAFDPLPGEERRNSNLIEKWGVGYWVRSDRDLASTIERLLADPKERYGMRERALARARPRAALEAAEAILRFAV